MIIAVPFVSLRFFPLLISTRSTLFFRERPQYLYNPCSIWRTPANTMPIVAEYAKSNRSSCKSCSKKIAVKSLRLGVITKGPGGIDMTRWHHFDCFSTDSDSIASVDDIQGLSALEKDDQDALTKLVEQRGEDEHAKKVGKMVEEDELQTNVNQQTTRKPKLLDEDEEIKKPASDEISGQKIKEKTGSLSSSKVIAEYAKSSRSTCKKCSQTIAAKELRLGLVTRNFRGYDMTQWHHLGCFPVDSDPIDSEEDIGGFSELQNGEQDSLKELVQQCGKKTLKMDEDNDESGIDNRLTEETNKRKHSQVGKMVEEDELQTSVNQQTTRKPKLLDEDEEIKKPASDEISGQKIKEKTGSPTSSKVIAEYAKSSRSTCKKCSQTIAAKELRLGLVTRNFRGYDMTQWHHMGCFPVDSNPIDSVEDIGGFSELQNGEQDSLKELVQQFGKKTLKMDEDNDESGTDNRLTEETNKRKHSQVGKMVEKNELQTSVIQQTTRKPKLLDEDEEIKKPASDEISGQKIKEKTGSPTSSKVIAEYAKSSRSTCKKCSQTIAAKELRLGLVTRNFRGYDMTQWHHMGCFPVDSNPIDSVEDIGGFSELQNGEQDSLKELVQQFGKKTLKMDEDNDESGTDNRLTEETNKRKHSQVGKMVEKNELQTSVNQQTTRKPKLLDEDEEIKKPASDEISGQKIKEKTGSPTSSKVIAEYAKSSRSTCKKCSQTIAAKELRLGLVTRNFRGYDMTQWHHLGCFPVDSDPIDSEEDIGGFSELQNGEQDSLKELVQQCGKKTLKMDEDNDESGIDDRLTEETNKRKHSQVGKMVEEDELQTSVNQQTTRKPKMNISETTSRVEVEAKISLSASDVKDKYRDASLLPKWKAFETVIFLERDDGLNDSEKIAAFDFDGCLAKTSVKVVGADAWSLMYPSIPEKLQSLYSQGYKLVIFTNESNIDRWKNKRQAAVDSKIGRLNSFIKSVDVPVQVFIACGVASSGGKDDLYRKPKAGMWQLMKKHFNSGIAIDMDKSFYVGDAAGRKGDHSDADIKFAQASGLKFYTPEEYFIS